MRLDATALTFAVARLPNAAKCALCQGPIERGAPRLGPSWGGNVSDVSAVHIECAPLLSPFSVLTRSLDKSVEGGAAIAREITLRCEAINAQRARRTALREHRTTDIDTTDFATIAPLSDRDGLPVVRVFVDLGRGPQSKGIANTAALSLCLHRSHRRRYVLETLDVDPPQPEDPAIPTAGALIIAHGEVRLSIARARKLDALRAQGVRDVVLWIVGGTEAQATETETGLRTMLNNAGFSGDEARVLRSAISSKPQLAPLFELLDEALAHTRPPPLLSKSAEHLRAERREHSARTLEELLADNDIEGARNALRVATDNARRSRTNEHDTLAAIAARNMRLDGLRDAALALCAVALRKEDAGPMLRWFDEQSQDARTFTRELESAARTLVTKGVDGIAPLLVREFLRHKSAAVARRIADLLASTNDGAAADTLKSAIAEWPADARAKRAREAIAKMRANARRR